MVIHVKDAEADRLIRQFAKARGIGITAAIKEAVEIAIASDAVANAANSGDDTEQQLKNFLEAFDRLPRPQISTDKKFFDELWEEN